MLRRIRHTAQWGTPVKTFKDILERMDENPLNSVFGAWPGDESDEVLTTQLREEDHTSDAYQLACMRASYDKLFTAVQDCLGTKDPDLDDVLKLLKNPSRSEYEDFCDRVGYANTCEGQDGIEVPSVHTMVGAWKSLTSDVDMYWGLRMARFRIEWDEEDGDVLWWKFPVTEPPYVGSPLDDDFPEYVTHFTHLPVPLEPAYE